MPVFQDLFEKSKAKPVEYNGKLIKLFDEFPINNGDKILCTFERTNSEWRQGIFIDIEGKFEILGEFVPFKTVFWEHTAPRKGEFIVWENKKRRQKTIYPKKGTITILNGWMTEDGSIFSCYNGAAMYVEEIENGRRYFCNDGHPDDDFDDLVFTLQKVGNVEEERSGQLQDSSRENP